MPIFTDVAQEESGTTITVTTKIGGTKFEYQLMKGTSENSNLKVELDNVFMKIDRNTFYLPPGNIRGRGTTVSHSRAQNAPH